jgi:hypothetical protein
MDFISKSCVARDLWLPHTLDRIPACAAAACEWIAIFAAPAEPIAWQSAYAVGATFDMR